MMAKTALSMGVKLILVALNDAHKSCLQRVLAAYVKNHMDADTAGFAPHDKAQKLEALKPNRLKLYESRKGVTSEAQPPLPGAGKATFEKSVNAALESLQTGTALPPAKRARVEPKPKPAPTPKPTPTAPSESAATESESAPTDSVADLLKMFG